MKIKAFIGVMLLAVATFAASVTPVTVIDSLRALLAKPATRGETLLVLGNESPFDAPIRIAKHFTNILYPIDHVSVFPATNGGEWYLTMLGGVTQVGAVTNLSLTCPDDTSVHAITVNLVGGVYALEVDQDASLLFPTPLYIESDVGTSHRVQVSLDSETGVYRLSVVQDLSAVPPQTVTFIAPDTTQHAITIANLAGIYTIQVQQ